ncbi:MAG: HAD family hydrolase [Candidatus Omnitrophota bacterium]
MDNFKVLNEFQESAIPATLNQIQEQDLRNYLVSRGFTSKNIVKQGEAYVKDDKLTDKGLRFMKLFGEVKGLSDEQHKMLNKITDIRFLNNDSAALAIGLAEKGIVELGDYNNKGLVSVINLARVLKPFATEISGKEIKDYQNISLIGQKLQFIKGLIVENKIKIDDPVVKDIVLAKLDLQKQVWDKIREISQNNGVGAETDKLRLNAVSRKLENQITYRDLEDIQARLNYPVLTDLIPLFMPDITSIEMARFSVIFDFAKDYNINLASSNLLELLDLTMDNKKADFARFIDKNTNDPALKIYAQRVVIYENALAEQAQHSIQLFAEKTKNIKEYEQNLREDEDIKFLKDFNIDPAKDFQLSLTQLKNLSEGKLGDNLLLRVYYGLMVSDEKIENIILQEQASVNLANYGVFEPHVLEGIAELRKLIKLRGIQGAISEVKLKYPEIADEVLKEHLLNFNPQHLDLIRGNIVSMTKKGIVPSLGSPLNALNSATNVAATMGFLRASSKMGEEIARELSGVQPSKETIVRLSGLSSFTGSSLKDLDTPEGVANIGEEIPVKLGFESGEKKAEVFKEIENTIFTSEGKIKVVLFDIGGVLLNYSRSNVISNFQKAIQSKSGEDISRDEVEKLIFTDESAQRLRVSLPIEDFIEGLNRYLREKLNSQVGFELKEFMNILFLDYVPPLNMVDLVRNLKGRGMPLYVLSNSFISNKFNFKELIKDKLNSHYSKPGEEEIFNDNNLIMSNEIGVAKPNSMAFNRALEKINLGLKAELNPGNILFLDDQWENANIAKQLGYRVARLNEEVSDLLNFFDANNRFYKAIGAEAVLPGYLEDIWRQYEVLEFQIPLLDDLKLVLVVHSSFFRKAGAIEALNEINKLQPGHKVRIMLSIYGEGADKIKVLFDDNHNIITAKTADELKLKLEAWKVKFQKDVVVLKPMGEKVDWEVKQVGFSEKTISTVAVAKAMQVLLGTASEEESYSRVILNRFKEFYKKSLAIIPKTYKNTKTQVFDGLDLPDTEFARGINDIENDADLISKFMDGFV